ncbi:MAG: hypothetical protein JJ895_14045 [Balneolaceae bacterium]|nr:hypothetical protein [Balneolaceae bacterium]
MHLKIITLLLIGILFQTDFVQAQMFSVSDKRETITQPRSILRIGTSLTNFTYVGNSSEGGPEQLNVEKPILALGFESMGLSANVLLGNRLSGIKDASFFDLNIKFTNGVALVRQQKLQFGIPVQLNTGLTTSNNDFYEDRFNQSFFSGGTGLFLNANPSRTLQTSVTGIVGYGFSNSNGGFFGGNLFYYSASTRINWLNALGDRTLSFGYDYIFRGYDIDVNLYDYDLSGHQFTLGISL